MFPEITKIQQHASGNKENTGENHLQKIFKVCSYLKKNKSDYLFITAPENIAWLLNIRGYDNPNSPIPNCHLLLDSKKNLYLIVNKEKAKNLIKEKKIKLSQIVDPNNFQLLTKKLNGNKIIIKKGRQMSPFKFYK